MICISWKQHMGVAASERRPPTCHCYSTTDLVLLVWRLNFPVVVHLFSIRQQEKQRRFHPAVRFSHRDRCRAGDCDLKIAHDTRRARLEALSLFLFSRFPQELLNHQGAVEQLRKRHNPPQRI